MCPRCKGISNIFLSPWVYIFAILAVAGGFLIYFFAKFVTDSVGLMTILQVFAPFAIFFFLSVFCVYFKKPVIKKVTKSTDGRYFDENGNEMTMKFGKLVPKEGGQSINNGYYDNNSYNTAPVNQNYQNNYDESYNYQTTAENMFIPTDNMNVSAENNKYDENYYLPVNDVITNDDSSLEQTKDLTKEFSQGTTQKIDVKINEDAKKINELENDIPVGNVARTRTESRIPNSGFEDLFQSYSTNREKTERAPRQERPSTVSQRRVQMDSTKKLVSQQTVQRQRTQNSNQGDRTNNSKGSSSSFRNL